MDDALAIRRVIEAGGPRVVFQPIVNLWSRTDVGYEALSRFPGNEGPEAWFHAAHVYGMDEALEIAAISNAMRDFTEAGIPGYLSINVCPCLLAKRDIGFVVNDHAFPVQLEITESWPIHEYRPVVNALDRLRREAHVTVAIDDVGAGYAAMRHIIHLSPDALKIDHELVTGMHNVEETARRAVLTAITALAARLHLDVIAEGIDSEPDALALRALGVNFGQAFMYARPMAIGDLARHIQP